MALYNSANTHQTSLLVSQQIPDFIRSDHPKFVTFLEKYYEFLADNTLFDTPDGDKYYGVDYAMRAIPDIHDIDNTDYEQFEEFFRSQYAQNFTQNYHPDTNPRLLYKNLINFYRSVGTEDSFRMLFRLLYNEEIELYYPRQDVLITSGGNFTQKTRLKVAYVDDINQLENKKIIGKSSGSYGTVEEVIVNPPNPSGFVAGNIFNISTTSSFVAKTSNTEIFHPERYIEDFQQSAYVYISDYSGTFSINEEIYAENATSLSVVNTIVLPTTSRVIWFENFAQYATVNGVVSVHDGLYNKSSNSTYVPWGDGSSQFAAANIAFTNTGIWHTHGDGKGEIKLVSNVENSYGGVVLQIGNNSSEATTTADLRHFVFGKNIGIKNDDTIYKLTIRARDIGGNSAASVPEGNRFSAGISCVRHDYRKISGVGYANTWNDPLWLASHQQAIDDSFFRYTAYFKGRELIKGVPTGNAYKSSNYGNGGRIDLQSGPTDSKRYYNSLDRAIAGEVLLPKNTTFIRPTFKVNEANNASYSQGITQVDYVMLEEIGVLQSQEGRGKYEGYYRDQSSLLSTKSAYLQDGHYWQNYAYEIRSHQQMGGANGYQTVVHNMVHPAGMKMFGTTMTHSTANGSIVSSNTNIGDTFSPSQLDSLSAWWSADTIGPQNVEYRRYDTATSKGTYGTERNRFPVGWSDFEDLDEDYDIKTFASVDVVAKGTDDSYFGGRALKIIDEHTSTGPNFDFPTTLGLGTSPFFGGGEMGNYPDEEFPIIIEPHKKWLLSFYSKVSNTTIDNGDFNSLLVYTAFANNAGADHSGIGLIGSQAVGNSYPTPSSSTVFKDFSAENVWERKSMVFDLSSSPHTRIGFRFQLPDRSAFSLATGNTTYHFDGWMLEEYDPALHGTEWGNHTPSPYIETGMNGSNVISWFDQSLNKHHVYANTHGGIFYAPQYIANVVGGKPAVRFSANTVKNAGNVYQYSSIGGTANSIALEFGDATNFKPTTSGLQAKSFSGGDFEDGRGTLASNSNSRPVTNTWTVMAVVRTNLALNAISYDSTLTQTIINSGYAGANNNLNDFAPAEGTLNLGYEIIGETGALQASVVNATAGLHSMNTAAITDFGGSLSSSNTESAFRIVGVSVNASSLSGASDDLLNFHIDGRRFANSEINNFGVSGFTGMDGYTQNVYVTSIGKWKPSNNVSNPQLSVTNTYLYGSGDWDGDIAEILVFNEKLSNTNISKVEGYLAHKYGLQDNLIHKDGIEKHANAYHWSFANTHDGWSFIDNQPNQNPPSTVGFEWYDNDTRSVIHVEAQAADSNTAMEIFLPRYIDGTYYNTFSIKYACYFGLAIGAPATQQYFNLAWKNTESETIYETQQLTPVSNHLSLFVTPSIDLSSNENWAGKKIKYLRFNFLHNNLGGGQEHKVEYIDISGRNFTHPYKYDEPPALGANTMDNTSY